MDQQVLIVSSDADHRESLEMTVQLSGQLPMAHYTKCSSVVEATEELKKKQFSLVVTELSLPKGLEGTNVIRKARCYSEHSKIVVIGHKDQIPFNHIKKMGGDIFIAHCKKEGDFNVMFMRLMETLFRNQFTYEMA